MSQNAFLLRTRDLLIIPKTTQRQFLCTLHPLSTVIFTTATVSAFVLLHNSNFNFHCYTQREATPTQKSARKCAATSRDFFRERLQSAFSLANQLRWIAQLAGSCLSLCRDYCLMFQVLTRSSLICLYVMILIFIRNQQDLVCLSVVIPVPRSRYRQNLVCFSAVILVQYFRCRQNPVGRIVSVS